MNERQESADILVFPEQIQARPSGMMFGQFFELAGRSINDGLYDPSSPHARTDGVRSDVVESLKALRPTHLRYPGGCAVSYFDWQDLVGPRENRPTKLFRVTGVPQSAAFGIPEAWQLCREVGAGLYLTVNAHTQSPDDAANLVEYLNGTTPTRWAELRRAHGYPDPFKVTYFSLGNEIYGGWQNGCKTAIEYARWCREAIRQMKRVDPSIKVTVCGLGRPDPEWDRTVLFHTVGLADMIAVHNYFGRPVFADSMAAGRVCAEMLDQLNSNITEAVDSVLGLSSRAVRDLGETAKNPVRPGIAFDEWNVWYRSRHDPACDLEEWFNFTDALTVATLFHTVLRNADTVHLSNISLFTNCLGSIMTTPDQLVRQSIWYTQKMIRDAFDRTDILQTAVNAPTFSAKHERFFCGIVNPEKAKDETLPSLLHFDNLPALDVVAGRQQHNGGFVLSVVQALEDRPIKTRIQVIGRKKKPETVTIHRLIGRNPEVINTFRDPEAVRVESETVPWQDEFTFPPATFTVLEFPSSL